MLDHYLIRLGGRQRIVNVGKAQHVIHNGVDKSIFQEEPVRQLSLGEVA